MSGEGHGQAIAAGLAIGIIAIASATGYWFFVSQGNTCDVGKEGVSCVSPPSISPSTSACSISTTTGTTEITSSTVTSTLTTLGTTCVYPPSVSSSTTVNSTSKSCPWYNPWC